MLNKYKLVAANYNPETGISTATIACRYGEFTGSTKIAEEDKDVESSFLGCRIAEGRAIVKALKAEKKSLATQIYSLENLEKSLKNMKDYRPHSLESRKLRRKIYELRDEKDYLEKRIVQFTASLRDEIKNGAEIRRAGLLLIQKKKDKNKK